MRPALTILLILVFMALAFFANYFLQKKIRPKESPGRLLLYFALMLTAIFLLSTLMILLITWFFPGERIKQ